MLYDALLYARLRLEIRKGEAAAPYIREKIRKTAEKYDLPTQKSVRICKGIETPFLCGMVRPILVLTEILAETIDEKVLIFKLWQKEFKSLDIRLNLKTAIYNSMHKGTGIKITGLFYGNEKETMEALKPFKDIGINSDFNLEYTTVLEANRKIQDSHPEYEKYK